MVIPRRIDKLPVRRLGVLTPMIVEHDPCVVAKLAIPLAHGKQEPFQRLADASPQGIPEERLRVAHETDFRQFQADLLPEQTHQAVGVGAGGGVALAVGDEQESGLRR